MLIFLKQCKILELQFILPLAQPQRDMSISIWLMKSSFWWHFFFYVVINFSWVFILRISNGGFFFLLKKLQCSILFANSSWPWNSLCLFRVDILAKVSLYIWHFSVIFNFILVSMYSHVWFGLGKWCLMPLLIMIQLYGGDQFYWWRKLQTCRKSLTNFTYSNVVSSTPRHDLDLNSQL